MKVILLVTLFLYPSCSKPGADQASAPADNMVAATPEPVVEAMLSQETDRVSALAGLKSLSSSNWANQDVEVRVWFGFGLFPLEGLVLKRSNGQWSAIHLMADRHYKPMKVSRKELPAPNSGWEACWQQLADAGLMTLPDGTDPPDPDVEGFEVQVRDGASYRSYQYVGPEYSELPAAKQMLRIGDIISSEFDLQRFKARKPGSL